MDRQVRQAMELVSRLERISVDSQLAHHASGVRVALMRWIDRLDTREKRMSSAKTTSLEALIKQGYSILESAAKELRGDI